MNCKCETCKCKKKYLIVNEGCDDKTTTELELSNKELELLIDFANKNNENSEYGCQPRIYIYDEYIEKKGYYDYYESKSLTEVQ